MGHHCSWSYRWVFKVDFIYSPIRFILHLHACNNNSATTVLNLFKESAANYGVPCHVRGDHGTENTLVRDFMQSMRGNAGFIGGRSVHNQRIERLWRDVFERALISWYEFFQELEKNGLDVDDPRHIEELHNGNLII
jgi:hypothetical protein